MLFENEGLAEGGLLPRFLIADAKAEAEDEPEEPYAMNTEVVEAWAGLIEDALGFRIKGSEPVLIDAEDEARAVLRDFTNESKRRTRQSGDLKDVGPFPKRWGEQAWKIALCFHMAEQGSRAGAQPLSRETALAAIETMRWFAREQLSVLHRAQSLPQSLRCRLGD